MQNRAVVLLLTIVTVTALAISVAGQGTSPGLQLVTRAAEALGGRDRVMAVKTLQIVGYGELAYMNGGGNISADPAAPQKWQKVLEFTRTIDVEHWRTRVQQRLKMDFVFASTELSERVRVSALNAPDQWGPSDHCRVEINVT